MAHPHPDPQRFIAFPDIEAIVSIGLRQAGIPNLAGVYSSIPAKNPTFPLIVIRRVGGFPAVRQYLDQARIQVDVWGGAKGDGPGQPTKSDIMDIAALARKTVMELEGTTIHEPVDAFVAAVNDGSGLYWLPDPHTGRDRYTFARLVYARSLAPTDVTEVAIDIYEDTEFDMPLRWEVDGSLVDLTGYTASMQILGGNYGPLYLDLTSEAPIGDQVQAITLGDFQVDGEDYNIRVTIPREITYLLDFNTARWFIEVTAPSTEVRRLAQGPAILHEDVTP